MGKKNIEWQKIDEERVIENEWIKVKRTSFGLPTGVEVKDYYLVEKPDVVVVIVLNENQETYLIREWERGIEEIGYKFPAGRLNEGEEIDVAANREVAEELGTVEGELIPLGITSVEPGLMNTKAHYFLLRVGSVNIDGSKREDSELFIGNWISWNEVNEMVSKNKVKNPFVIVGSRLVDTYLKENC